MPAISVVVATWNGLDLLKACVAALSVQTLEHELVVVDNGSQDGTAEWVRTAVPGARLVPLAHNLGFAGGNNVGLRVAGGDMLVLVNNDTLPPPSFLANITAPLATCPAAGSVAGVLTFAHRPELVASAGIAPGRDGVHRDAHLLAPVSSLPTGPQEIFGASGGAVCFRRRALEDVGLFAGRFFNYLEDADHAWRLRLRGWSSVLAPDARLPHVYSATSGHFSPFKLRLLALNRWRVLLRSVPTALLQKHACTILRYDVLAVAYGSLTGNWEVVRGRLDAIREIALLRRERRALAGATRTSADELDRWLAPAATVSEVLNERRQLDEVLSSREM
ncbi:MAG TPA: glycosyltransferase family 2 protein [Herpetosiphonaceae bacterium]|nr:glycosyltransferase family 2 protein [Herpetosiphonaceae bacterium]